MLRDQRHRERSRRFFALFAAERSGWPGIRFYLRNPAQMLAPQHDSGALWISIPAPFFEERERANMTRAIPALSRRLSPWLAAICLGAASVLISAPALARGPDGIADVAEKVIDAVVNISTSQTIEAKGGGGDDKKTDLAVLKFKPVKPLVAVKFGDSDKLRLGEWVIAIGNPFTLGGTVTAGIVSARNRDINSGPYDSYIQTDAAINRGNSGGPLFNLEGEVIGVNTLIISPSGGSIGISLAVPSKTVGGVVDQLRQFGELRRGWLRVRIQQVTDEIAASLNIKPARGALIAGVEDKGPAKPAGIEPGDVVVKFDGKDIKEPKDLSRVVADTAVGKEVEVVIIRKGQEETRKVTLGRLEDGEKAVQAAAKTQAEPAEKPVTQKALGLDLATLSKDLRTRYKIKDSVKGVIITSVDGTSDAAEKRLSAGEVIVEVAQEAVSNAADVKKRVDQLKKDGKKSILLLVSNADGELRFVALSVQ